MRKIWKPDLSVIVTGCAWILHSNAAGRRRKNGSHQEENAGRGHHWNSKSRRCPNDTQRGEGKFGDVEISEKLDAKMATGGKQIYDLKCSSWLTKLPPATASSIPSYPQLWIAMGPGSMQKAVFVVKKVAMGSTP